MQQCGRGIKDLGRKNLSGQVKAVNGQKTERLVFLRVGNHPGFGGS